jgi:hypothetical protein
MDNEWIYTERKILYVYNQTSKKLQIRLFVVVKSICGMRGERSVSLSAHARVRFRVLYRTVVYDSQTFLSAVDSFGVNLLHSF